MSQYEAKWDTLHDLQQQGELEQAMEGFSSLCQRHPPYPRACYDQIRLLFKLERYETAEASSLSFIEQYPDHALAPVAAKRLTRFYISQGALSAGELRLRELGQKVQNTEVHDTVLYGLAQFYEGISQPQKEIQTLVQFLEIFDRWNSQLWDDAIWCLIRRYHAMGDLSASKSRINELLSTRESSLVIGSYNSRYYDKAQLLLGEIYLAEGSNNAAFRAFDVLIQKRTSRFHDHAYFGAAQARFASAKQKQGCSILTDLLDNKPLEPIRSQALTLFTKKGCALLKRR